MTTPTERILQKWASQGCSFVHYLDGNKGNLKPCNLAWVPEKEFLQRFEFLERSTDWDFFLTPEEADLVRRPEWRRELFAALWSSSSSNKRQKLA